MELLGKEIIYFQYLYYTIGCLKSGDTTTLRSTSGQVCIWRHWMRTGRSIRLWVNGLFQLEEFIVFSSPNPIFKIYVKLLVFAF